MAERLEKMPPITKQTQMDPDLTESLNIRRQAVKNMKKQTITMEHRLRFHMFHAWRMGRGTIAAIARATGYSEYWVSQLFNRIRNSDKLLRRYAEFQKEEYPDDPIPDFPPE